jgi:hypothetical protein
MLTLRSWFNLCYVIFAWCLTPVLLFAQANPRKVQFDKDWAEVDLYLKHGKIDLVMEKIMIIDAQGMESEYTSKVFDVINHYLSLALKENRKDNHCVWFEKIFLFELDRKEKFLHPKLFRFIHTDEHYHFPQNQLPDVNPVIRAKCISGMNSLSSIVISREAPSLVFKNQAAFILDADTNFQSSRHASSSFIIADGDSQIESVKMSIVIVRGSLTKCERTYNSFLFLNGCLTDEKTTQKIVGDNRRSESHINLESSKTLKWLNWFETSEIGITAELKDDQILITKIVKDSDFANAGLKVGDVVSRIDGKALFDADGFRRSIRRAMFQGKIEMRIIRNNEVINAKFNLQPWRAPNGM